MSTDYVTQETQGQPLERVSEIDRLHKPEHVAQTEFWKTVPGNSSCFAQVLQFCFLRVGSTYAHSLHSEKCIHNAQDPSLPQRNLGLRKYIGNYSHILCNNKYIILKTMSQFSMTSRSLHNYVKRLATLLSKLKIISSIFVVFCSRGQMTIRI